MPRYRFTGFIETVLHGLSHDVNATLHRKDHGQPAGSTVVVLPGDEITTTENYDHAALEPVKSRAAERSPAESKRAPRSRKPRAPKNEPDAPARGDDGGTAPTTSSESE